MKDRFVDEVEFAKFANEFDVAKHLDLCNSTLLLLVRGEWAVIFVEDYKKEFLNNLLQDQILYDTYVSNVIYLRSTFLARFSNSS